MEIVHSLDIQLSITIDTNKHTIQKPFTYEPGEGGDYSLDEFLAEAARWANEELDEIQ